MSGRRKELDASDLLRVAEDPANDGRSMQGKVAESGTMCSPIHGAVGHFPQGLIRPLSKARDTRLQITSTLGRAVGDPEQCSPMYGDAAGLAGGGSVMIASSPIVDSAQQDPDDKSDEEGGNAKKQKYMTTGPSKFENPEDDEIAEPSESGERVIDVTPSFEADAMSTRDDVTGSLEVDAPEENLDMAGFETVKPSVSQIQIYDTLPPPPIGKGRLEIQPEMLQELSRLHQANTLEAHEELLRRLQQMGVYSAQRWEDIHSNPRLRHNLSNIGEDRVNPFAKLLTRKLIEGIDEDSVILELGSGFGNDAVHFAEHTGAHVIGVDSSQRAITKAQINIGEKGLRDRVNLTCHDFIAVLEQSKGMNLDMIYSYSTLHYFPPLVLQQRIFPMIADALRANQPGAQHGQLCFAMKLGSSASARGANQHKLVPGDPTNPSFDERDELVRWYYKDKRTLLSLVEHSHNVTYAHVVPVRGYDRNGETEIFCYVKAEPKDLPEAA